MSKTPHTIYKGMLLDIDSGHQVNCTCSQSGHALYDFATCVQTIVGSTGHSTWQSTDLDIFCTHEVAPFAGGD